MTRRRSVIPLVLCCFLSSASCAQRQPLVPDRDTAVKTTAKAIRDTAAAIGVFQDTVIYGEANRWISTNDARVLLEATSKVSANGQKASAMLRLIASDATTIDLMGILEIMARDIGQIAQSIVIKDESRRQRVAASIQLAQASLNSARLVLASSRGLPISVAVPSGGSK